MIVVEMLQVLTERLLCLRECPAQPAHTGWGDRFEQRVMPAVTPRVPRTSDHFHAVGIHHALDRDLPLCHDQEISALP